MDAAQPSTTPPHMQAPGEDRHVALALVNTEFTRPSGPYDGLRDSTGASAWLTERGLIPSGFPIGERETDRLRELRVGLRELFDAHVKGTSPGPGALSVLNSALATAPAVREVHWEDAGAVAVVRRPAGDPVGAALAALAEDGVDLLTGPAAQKLSACAAPGCTRLFARTHAARRWCSDRCGNRVRAARHYLDHRSARRRSS